MSRASTAVFGVTLFLASLLLFLLEPMFGRMVLPLLGGAPAVWNTCLVFFQLTLLLGYLYAWASARWLGRRAQVAAHGALLVVAVVVLPVRIVPGWAPPTATNPIPWLLAVLTVSIGLPFFVASTTAPMLQHWFAQTDHPDAEDPYFLYQASNLGSLLALLAYPVVVEPWLGLRQQGAAWTVGYGAFGVLVGVCAWALLRAPVKAPAPAAPADAPAPRKRKKSRAAADAARVPNAESRIPASRQLRWALLAAVPSSLLLGVTTYLSTDVAAVPLLWVVPLALYLFTFIVAFARRPWVSRHTLVVAVPWLIVPLVMVLVLEATQPAWALIPLHVAAFTVIALLCHRQLADDRPSKDHLTLFYLWLSIGGAVGGLFNAILAPAIFRSTLEYPIALVAACFLKPARDAASAKPAPWRDVLLPAALGVAVFALLRSSGRLFPDVAAGADIVSLVALFVCFLFSPRPVRFGLGIAAVLMAANTRPHMLGTVVDTERSFFGMHRVIDDRTEPIRWLLHGTTLHGAQSRAPGESREPLTYYAREGPLGQLFDALARESRPTSVGVLGLGAGAVTAHARPGQRWVFYEIDPVVVRIARDSGYFTFLRETPAPTDIVLGDGRLALARDTNARYDLLLLDAFSSDSVPVHLLTREALQIYLDRLNPHGLLVFNTANRYLSVNRVVADLARDAGLVHLWQRFEVPTAEGMRKGKTPSQFVVVARTREDVAVIADSGRWTEVPGDPGTVWTDDYANPLGLLLRR